jgi:glutamate-1-semialdehyde 2,1-aminomutase
MADISEYYQKVLDSVGLPADDGNISQNLYKYAKTRIPGGTQLLSKRPEMCAPEQWPAYFSKATGCETWDLDGRHYYDLALHGIASCLLGFCDPDVTEAVIRRIELGSMSTLNPPEEVELADRLCEIHPWAQQARFARTGGESGVIAIRIARATTKRSLVAICGYHGWHDWYLAANLGEEDSLDGHLLPGLDPVGVPRELKSTTVTFRSNDFQQFDDIIKLHGDRLAAVVMEPARYSDPEPGFLEHIRRETQKCGALLIFDEITIGWRMYYGGIHLKFGVYPDIAIFAKALGNGHPVAAIIGTRAAMTGANTSFISSTYWTESVGPVAALATLEKMSRLNVPEHVAHIGEMITSFWQKHARKHGLQITIDPGYPALAHFKFEHEAANALNTLYTQLMLERGFLARPAVYPTLAHTEEIISLYGKAIDEVFLEISQAVEKKDFLKRLKGPVAHTGFARLT